VIPARHRPAAHHAAIIMAPGALHHTPRCNYGA
jgi:hypothetical protein